MSAPRISILLPLQDDREAGVDCVRAWVDGQSADGNDYEIVAVAMGEDPALEGAVRPLLREQDRWIATNAVNEYEAFNVGAEAAHGEYVFLTEAHCIPEPHCMAATLEELSGNRHAGLRARSNPDSQGTFGAFEMRAVEGALAAEEDPEHWRRVLIHGTAIRRDVYIDAGGVPARFGDFAPWVLSMTLSERGQRPGFSPRPALSHVYDGDFAKVEACARSFMAGEVLYRCEHPEEATDRYLPWAGVWEGQLEFTRSGALRALRAGLRLRRGTWRALLRYATTAGFGLRTSVAAVGLRAKLAKARAHIARDPARREKSFREFWDLSGRRGRLEGLARVDPRPPELPLAERIDLTAPHAGRVIGFHQPETPEGERPFRWTAPLALLHVYVPGDGRMRARIELRPSEWVMDAWVRVAVDDDVVPVSVSADAIEFEIDCGEHWIAVGSKPSRPDRNVNGGDRRVLGLPVRSLSFEPTTPT